MRPAGEHGKKGVLTYLLERLQWSVEIAYVVCLGQPNVLEPDGSGTVRPRRRLAEIHNRTTRDSRRTDFFAVVLSE